MLTQLKAEINSEISENLMQDPSNILRLLENLIIF